MSDNLNKQPIKPNVDTNSEKELSEYQKKLNEQEGEHTYRLRKVVFNIARCGLHLLAFLIGILSFIWLWHITTPETWRWLPPLEVQMIERILFSSILITASGRYFSKFGLFDKNK